MKNGGKELNNWEDLVQKVIKAKAKTSFLPFLILKEIDKHVTHSKQLVKNIKASSSSYRTPMKDPRIDKPKFQNQKTKPAAS